MNAPVDPRVTVHSGLDLLPCAALAFAGGTVGMFSQKSPDKAGPNEDALLLIDIDDRCGVLAVADGIGGTPAGARAARGALEQLTASIASGCGGGRELRDCILDGFEAANRAVAALGVGAGTTLAAVEKDGAAVRGYHVGDTAILVVGQRGRIKHLSISHSPVGYGVEAGLLDEEEAIFHEDRHVVSNAVGSEDMKIEIGPTLRLAPRDTVLVASDGLFDNLRVDEITDAIRIGPLPAVCERLARRCIERMSAADTEHPGKPDDVTFLVFRGAAQRASGARDRED